MDLSFLPEVEQKEVKELAYRYEREGFHRQELEAEKNELVKNQMGKELFKNINYRVAAVDEEFTKFRNDLIAKKDKFNFMIYLDKLKEKDEEFQKKYREGDPCYRLLYIQVYYPYFNQYMLLDYLTYKGFILDENNELDNLQLRTMYDRITRKCLETGYIGPTMKL